MRWRTLEAQLLAPSSKMGSGMDGKLKDETTKGASIILALSQPISPEELPGLNLPLRKRLGEGGDRGKREKKGLSEAISL